MRKQIKKYWFLVLGIIIVILDSGFDAINPILIDLSISPKIINYVKVAFAIYGIVRLKQSEPIRKKV